MLKLQEIFVHQKVVIEKVSRAAPVLPPPPRDCSAAASRGASPGQTAAEPRPGERLSSKRRRATRHMRKDGSSSDFGQRRGGPRAAGGPELLRGAEQAPGPTPSSPTSTGERTHSSAPSPKAVAPREGHASRSSSSSKPRTAAGWLAGEEEGPAPAHYCWRGRGSRVWSVPTKDTPRWGGGKGSGASQALGGALLPPSPREARRGPRPTVSPTRRGTEKLVQFKNTLVS